MITQQDPTSNRPYYAYVSSEAVGTDESVECTKLNDAAYLAWLDSTTTTRASGIHVTRISKFRHHWNALKSRLTSFFVKPKTVPWNGLRHAALHQNWKNPDGQGN